MLTLVLDANTGAAVENTIIPLNANVANLFMFFFIINYPSLCVLYKKCLCRQFFHTLFAFVCFRLFSY
ncbi:hypothetical protein HMPREF6123_1925 [Oribacterium sinus F0268]|uniref:Uncharacterized protein n=1 Tax=Oribacterium sinus F0268 TaxID=585501 RepID=C2KZK6_9FIRM|nr:hypothetical protein HMPREF6123_1925 [Oribacterium sinus F0268]